MTYSERAVRYADSVIAGETPACKFVIQACERFISDLKRDDIYLNQDEAERWCRFLEKLPHVKGKWAATKQTLILSDWQIFCTVNIYGWYFTATNRRRFRDIYIEVPRKNGKTFWIAGLGLGHLCIDGEFGAEIYCGATSEKQAFEVFRPAKQICERTPDLREHYGLDVNAKNLNILETGSRFEPVIGKPGDGASPSCGIADEFHEHPDSDQVDTFTTGMGARDNPVMLHITTAGSDMGGPCYAKRDEVKKVLDGSVVDDTIFGIIYTIDEDDQWDTVEAQQKANPNYGISVDGVFLKAQLDAAKRSAIKQAAYKTKHLNVWVGAKAAWMNMLAYQVCRKDISIEQYKGQRCYVGIDLASKIDVASMVAYFPDSGAVFAKHYLPEERILDGGNTRYKAWHADGWIEATPGNVIDYSYIEDDLIAFKSDFEVIEVAYDPFQATQFSVRMQEQGFPMIEVGATVKNFSEPMKELEALVLKKSIKFSLDPVLMWMFGNVVAKLDKKDNIFPDKEKPENKIDGVVAIIMAISRAIVHRETGTLDDFLANPVSI